MSGWFTLEAVYAKKGDALILHYGSKTKPRWILIDGGHTGVYDEFLRPRLEELKLAWPKRLNKKGRLPLEMVMVSHADADHLEGVLDLTAHMCREGLGGPEAPVDFKTLWFNGFEDLIANPPEEASILDQIVQTAAFDQPDGLAIPTELHEDEDARAVVASTRQGRRLLQDAKLLEIDVNPQYGSELVMRAGAYPSITKYPAGLKFTLLNPDEGRVNSLRARWKKDLKKILKNKTASADAASFKDTSPFNLSSIVVLAECNAKKMLLTGDARGDDLISGLSEEGLLDSEGKIEVELFKVPHHGSDRNMKVETFRDVTAKHYLISANGEHHNPEPATLDMLVAGRMMTREDGYTVYFTFPEEAFKRIPEELANKKRKVRKQKDALEALDRWLKTKRPKNMMVVYRDLDRYSLAVDLGSEKVAFTKMS